MTTSKAAGEEIRMDLKCHTNFEVEGAIHKEGIYYTVTATDGRIILKGDIFSLTCSDNQLTQLDISKNSYMAVLYCHNNKLTQLDLSKNLYIQVLHCHNNQLSQLNVSQNTKLQELDCSENQIKKEAMDALIASLPDRSKEEEKGDFIVIDTDGIEANVCTEKQVANAHAKGWIPKKWENGDRVDYEGSEEVAIDAILAQEEATIIAIYSVDGRRLAELQQGVNIVRLSNGKTHKVLITDKQ
ncbi:hypothetical protein [Porphyromonas circumdentaria]|uniref:hypothetical protein n=1 Tax=Porphyromonas circumdentaria TaxID=29524 RepID=UPI0026DD13BC|nr:hypothetical protein [Porphyromonas circumdentaria]MDO4722922.1 hypothetical protein [Porphyromonas circumdentaria]